MQLEVAFLPRDITHLPRRVALVIDVVRATSTLDAIFAAGARSVALAESIEQARAAAQHDSARLLIGEMAGLPPAGFSYGNSPVVLAEADLRDRDVVFTTTNGTRALVAVAGAAFVLSACMRNGPAVVAAAYHLAQTHGLDLSIVCAGRAHGTQQGQDDVICAGYLVELLIGAAGGKLAPWQPDADFAQSLPPAPPVDGLDLDDSAWLALRVYRSVVADPQAPTSAEIERVFRTTGVGQGLHRLQADGDTAYCAVIAVSDRVPQLHGTQYPLRLVANESTL